MPELTGLGVYGDLPVERLRLLAVLPHLNHLHFNSHSRWTSQLSGALSALPSLTSLELAAVSPSVGWVELAAARPWQRLNLGYAHVPDEFFNALDRVDTLFSLELGKTTHSRARLERFRSDHPRVDVMSSTSRPLDRQVAERLLRLGGIVIEVIDGIGIHVIRELDELPDTEFSLTRIYVKRCDAFDDRMLASLTGLDNLRGVYLSGAAVSDTGLGALDQLSYLDAISLTPQHMTERGLKTIARQQRLVGLSIPSADPASLRHLASLTKLWSLQFEQVDQKHAAEVLELAATQFPELTTFSPGRLMPPGELAPTLLKFTKLRVLVGNENLFEPNVVAVLAQHPSLREIHIFGGGSRPWANLAPLLKIQEVLVGVMTLSTDHITHLAELPQLQTLTFDRIKFTPESLAQTGKLRHARVMKFLDCELSDAEWARISESLPNSELLRNGKPRKLAMPTNSQ